MIDPRTVYRVSEGGAADSPVRAVILLYQQIIEDLRLALQAINRNDVEARTVAINHAILVLAHLQAHLNPEPGNRAVIHLQRFYEILRVQLIEAQCTISKAILDEGISALIAVMDVWARAEFSGAVSSRSAGGINSNREIHANEQEANQRWNL